MVEENVKYKNKIREKFLIRLVKFLAEIYLAWFIKWMKIRGSVNKKKRNKIMSNKHSTNNTMLGVSGHTNNQMENKVHSVKMIPQILQPSHPVIPEC